MNECKNQIYSNDYFDFISNERNFFGAGAMGDCVQKIDMEYQIVYVPREGQPDVGIDSYTYRAIPKCYGLLDRTALEVTGILKLQNQPVLQLKGDGVMIGFLDTGIDYQNPLFCFSDGSSRISFLWDQTIMDGTPPEGILYGAEYDREKINQALSSENPLELVPSVDENGHGTFLAGVACGGEDIANNFIGAAPNAEIAVVKLKEAKQYLKEYYFLPQDMIAYQENDIMMAVSYLNQKALERNVPLILCIAVGTSMGNHGDGGALNNYLNYMSTRRMRGIVTAAGNEANTRHHFRGRIQSDMEFEDVEINVDKNRDGFFVELWAGAPELFAVSIISPTGEEVPRIPVRTGSSQIYTFLFERTTISIEYCLEVTQEANQLIYIRFLNAKRGLWILRVYPQSIITGEYNVWLPMEQMTKGEVFFLRPNPDTTMTMPATARNVITVGGFQASNDALFSDSGRGYTITGFIKPDFAAPAVNVYGPTRFNRFLTYTGTSAAAAITAGTCAQVFQWAFVEENAPDFSNAAMKNVLIRGARKTEERSYPNREWGYGILDVYQAFINLRE